MSIFTTIAVAQDRYATCKQCQHWIDKARLCDKCGCFMPFKVRFYNANCPIGRWNTDRGAQSTIEPELNLESQEETNERNKEQ